MEGLEVTVLLGLAILAGTVLAPRLRIATPLVLVVIGLLLGFVPALRDIQLPPETVLLLFLPVMLFWEGAPYGTALRRASRSMPRRTRTRRREASTSARCTAATAGPRATRS